MMLLLSLLIYVPRDERFGHLKMSDLIAYALKSISQLLRPDELASILVGPQKHFDSLEDVLKLYEGGIELPEGVLKSVRDNIPAETIKELFRTDGEKFLKFPVPQVIKGIYYIRQSLSTHNMTLMNILILFGKLICLNKRSFMHCPLIYCLLGF